MDIRQKKICENVQNGRFLEECIPQFFNYLADQYYVSAQIQLAMNYFTLYESYYDDEDTWSSEVMEAINKVNNILREHLTGKLNGNEREKAICEMDNIRNDIMRRMTLLTAYMDIFQNYEYVLNRVENRFNKSAEVPEDLEYARRILQYIFDSEDNVIINEKIKEIIAQLPVRITRQKYFDILKDSIGTYLGAEGSTLDSFLNILRSSAMLNLDEGMESLYPGLWEKKEYLSGLDYTNLTEEVFEKAKTAFQASTLYLETEISLWYGLQEIVNEVYAILLCSPYSGMMGSLQENAEKAAVAIINDISNYFADNEKKEIQEGVVNQFSHLEGVQEELIYDQETLESAFYEALNQHNVLVKSLMLEQFMNVLRRTQDLLSNSLFIELEARTNDNPAVDEERIKKEILLLENELKELFTGQDRMVTRAVMANTINKLPVFFKDHKEVMDYVIYSLERCTDRYEKAACSEIIDEIMAE